MHISPKSNLAGWDRALRIGIGIGLLLFAALSTLAMALGAILAFFGGAQLITGVGGY